MHFMRIKILIFILLITSVFSNSESVNKKLKFSKLNNNILKEYSESTHDKLDVHIKNLAVVRKVDTKQHKEVQNYLISQFDKEFWDVELDTFEELTPNGLKTFTNIIVDSKVGDGRTTSHQHSQTMIIAAHYDSKIIPGKSFKAAIDSAVPCALMIDLAMKMQDSGVLMESQRRLKLIFFDGEEAFKEWTKTDSLYGSRHLADQLSLKQLVKEETGEVKPFYESVDIFVLLDLIGSPSPVFYYFYEKTLDQFKHLCEIEEKMQSKRLISYKATKYFQDRHLTHEVQDDHIPFLPYNIPVLHLIPIPFPSVWHTEKDTIENLDETVIEDLSKIFKVFVASYLKYKE
ncbi:peptidase M28E domain containing-protein [Tieghemostelium lacteum]|uniref:Peptidase M28E domain containing-protein n=1 Tax=Tieghemostelium lacteum TaxID=361077 RepID=A0A152A9S1_TIELA|nr:peptidase M28E domain containing-protein [Tieghemostelium lacteum]|eukprot:KYR02969.1 peptidase M28E domain containing-protein [Tieghemostelium lacteum]